MLGLTATAIGNSELLVEALFNAGFISANAFSTDYRSTSETSKITIGGYDTSIVSDFNDFQFVSIVGSFHWEVPCSMIAYNGTDQGLNASIGILDTGTSLTYFETPNGDWDKIYGNMTSGKTWGYSTGSNLRACHCNSIDDFSDITFTFGGFNITMNVSSFVYLEAAGICSFYIDGINYSFSTPSILLGDSFLRNYYIYHDAANRRAGFHVSGSATTLSSTASTSTLVDSEGYLPIKLSISSLIFILVFLSVL